MKALIAKNNALQEQNSLYKEQMDRLQRQLDEHELNEEFRKKQFEDLQTDFNLSQRDNKRLAQENQMLAEQVQRLTDNSTERPTAKFSLNYQQNADNKSVNSKRYVPQKELVACNQEQFELTGKGSTTPLTITNGVTSYNQTSDDLSSVTVNYNASSRNAGESRAQQYKFNSAPSIKDHAVTPSSHVHQDNGALQI